MIEQTEVFIESFVSSKDEILFAVYNWDSAFSIETDFESYSEAKLWAWDHNYKLRS